MLRFKLPRIRVYLLGYIFSPSWTVTLLTVLLFILLSRLGFWQLQRAEQKRLLERQFKQTVVMSLPLASLSLGSYHRLEVTGNYDNNHIIFLDNKTYKQAAGYHVFTPFIVANSNKLLLIDRGFVAIRNRDALPVIPPQTGKHTLQGFMYFPQKGFTLKHETIKSDWPLVVQTIDLKQLAYILNAPVYPFYLLLEKGEDSNFIRDWHPASFPSYRHLGYAVQWFSLALVLLVIYIVVNTRKEHGD